MLEMPRFARIEDFCGLWMIEERAFRAQWDFAARIDLAAHIRANLEAPPVIRSEMQVLGSNSGQNVAFIPVSGSLMKGESSFGGTSTVQLRRDVRAAAADPNVSAILFGIESPGGTVAGIEDLAADVRAARRKKPVWSHIDDMAASAAYWLASQTEQIFANNATALVGSIGTYLTVLDSSAAAEKEGVRVLNFATGPLKTAGLPGTAVTDEQAAYFQGIVNAAQAEFDKAVLKGRGLTAGQLADVRTGAMFPAPEALGKRLIDGIRPLEKTIDALAQSAKRRQ